MRNATSKQWSCRVFNDTKISFAHFSAIWLSINSSQHLSKFSHRATILTLTVMMGPWVVTELRKRAYRLARAVSDILEPPDVAINQLKFEPARSAAVKMALDAGWIEGLRDGRLHSSSELVTPGQSEELLGTLVCSHH